MLGKERMRADTERERAQEEGRRADNELAARLHVESELAASKELVERLQLLVKEYERARFGKRSEKFDPDQLQLVLEDIEIAIAEAQEREEDRARRSGRPATGQRTGRAARAFTAKPDSHKTLYDFMDGATLEEISQARKEGAKKLTYRYRWFSAAPLRDGKDALNVNWIGVTICDAKGKTTYDGAFVTSLEVSRENVAEIAACARARWKIENESFNILKNNGYHLEHNFGHGKQNLAMLFAAMNLLAFAMHTVCDCLEDLWVEAREAKRARKRFFEHMRIPTQSGRGFRFDAGRRSEMKPATIPN